MEMYENFNLKTLTAILPQKAEKAVGEKIVSLKFLGGGSYGRVFRATNEKGEVYALKAYRRKGMQNEEAAQLKILSENTKVPMPEVLFTYEDEEASLLAMSFIEGRNVLDPRYLFKSKQQKRAFSQAVIKGMLSWHEVKNEKYGELSNPTYESWHSFYSEQYLDPLFALMKEKVKEGKFKKADLDFLFKAREIYDKIGDEPECAVLIHGDLNIMNIMANPKDFTLTGFIDPCGCMWASREYDLYQFRNMWGDKFGLYEQYKKHCPISKDGDYRVAFFAAINEINCLFKSGESFSIWKGHCFKLLKTEMKRYL
ncbi:MAG: fructosamine kinase family protein [Acutalibacteraceae bacterium]